MEIQTKPVNNNIPWVEKYRPGSLKDLISHQSILDTLRRFTDANSMPNLLFYGPPGTGKTSTIIALAKEIYKDDYKKSVLQLNASDERGIGVVREQIKSFASTMTLSNNPNKAVKLVILDQADMMTNAAQFALRRIIEKNWKNTRFCLISNYVSKIIPALQSRCTRFKFKQIAFESARTRIQQICQAQEININDDGIKAVFHLCEGDMRRVVNMLQSLSISNTTLSIKKITAQEVYQFTGNPSPRTMEQIFNILLLKDCKDAFRVIREMQLQYGISLQSILKQVYNLMLEYDMEQTQKAFIIQRLGDLQYRLSLGCDEKIQLASLVGVFVQSRIITK